VNFSVANNAMHCRIHTFLDVSAALLYIVTVTTQTYSFSVEIFVVLVCLFNVKIVLTFAPKKTLNYVYGTQASAKYTR